MNSDSTSPATVLSDPAEICLELFELRSVLVPAWDSGTPFRRTIYRRLHEFERLYKKRIAIRARPVMVDGQKLVRLTPDLTLPIARGIMGG